MSKRGFYYSISSEGVVCEYRHFDTSLRPPAEMRGKSFPSTFYELFCNGETDRALRRVAVTFTDGKITITYSNHKTGGTVKIEGVAV